MSSASSGRASWVASAPALGPGFASEGLAFFLEAIFIGIYLYGWRRLRPRTHFLIGLALPPAGVLGSVSVLSANAFMNTPAGVTLDSGRVASVDVLKALFTPALGYEFWHFTIALYMTAGFAVASVYAVSQLVVGDLSARALVQDQPAKFAAVEITWTTRDHNPEVIGGLIDDAGGVALGVSIPALDSILVGYSPNTRGEGPEHLSGRLAAFQCRGQPVLFRRRRLPESVWFYRAAALAGIGCYVAVEAGWVTTEVGRQPWIVYGVMRVADAVTNAPAGFVWSMLGTLVVIYAVIAYFFVTLLLRLAARWRREDEREPSSPEEGVPYGPRPGRFAPDV